MEQVCQLIQIILLCEEMMHYGKFLILFSWIVPQKTCASFFGEIHKTKSFHNKKDMRNWFLNEI